MRRKLARSPFSTQLYSTQLYSTPIPFSSNSISASITTAWKRQRSPFHDPSKSCNPSLNQASTRPWILFASHLPSCTVYRQSASLMHRHNKASHIQRPHLQLHRPFALSSALHNSPQSQYGDTLTINFAFFAFEEFHSLDSLFVA